MSTLARERMQKVLERWFLNEPLLFSIWSDHQVISAAVSTLRVGAGIIRYNPDFIDSLTPIQLEAVMRCEAVRILLKHPYSRCLAPAHIAWQASNLTLAEHLGTLPIALPRAVDVFGHHDHDRQFYEFYHHRLLEQARQSSAKAGGDDTTETVPPPQQPPSPPTGSASADTTPESPEPAGRTSQPRSAAPTDATGSPHRLDDHLHSPGTGQENTRDWQNDELFSEKIDSRVSDAELNQHWGNLPGSLRERILANRQPQLDYRSVLRLFHQSVLSRQRRLTRMKCSRRYGFLYQGSRYDFTTRLLIAVDVSGSIDTDDLALAFSMVNRFFRYGIESIDVVAFDTEIQGTVQSLKRARREMTITGRGGTNFNAVIDYLDQHPDYDGVLIVTDGCAPCPRPPRARRIPLLWVFIDQGTWEASNTRLRSLGRSLYLKNRRG